MHVLVQLPVSMDHPSCATEVDNICAVFCFWASPHPERVTPDEIPRVFVSGSPLRSAPPSYETVAQRNDARVLVSPVPSETLL